ncbi:T9SS type A sorting domain-containing protein [Winogradskyella sp. 3972H.M.0a.05]
MNGQLVKTVTNKFEEISIAELESAVYLLKMYGQNASTQTSRLVKQ